MRETSELSSNLPKSPEPVKHALAHSELFSKYSNKYAQQLARQADWSEDQKEEHLQTLREVRREWVAGWDDARREEEIGNGENKVVKGWPAGMNNAVRRNLRRSE